MSPKFEIRLSLTVPPHILALFRASRGETVAEAPSATAPAELVTLYQQAINTCNLVHQAERILHPVVGDTLYETLAAEVQKAEKEAQEAQRKAALLKGLLPPRETEESSEECSNEDEDADDGGVDEVESEGRKYRVRILHYLLRGPSLRNLEDAAAELSQMTSVPKKDLEEKIRGVIHRNHVLLSLEVIDGVEKIRKTPVEDPLGSLHRTLLAKVHARDWLLSLPTIRRKSGVEYRVLVDLMCQMEKMQWVRHVKGERWSIVASPTEGAQIPRTLDKFKTSLVYRDRKDLRNKPRRLPETEPTSEDLIAEIFPPDGAPWLPGK